ncbi:MAG: hypothetical protein N4A72_17455 [Bacteroidales bacterium]|jgi:hypothetical protein|nr:hypothetical protein [Bacteroidales bacterium]
MAIRGHKFVYLRFVNNFNNLQLATTKQMELRNLIGKKISDIRIEVKDFPYDGSIPLDESVSHIILDSNEIIEIPYLNSNCFLLEEALSKNQKTIFEENGNKSILHRLFFQSDSDNLITRNTNNIKDKEITAIFQYDSLYSDKGREWDKCLIQVESGFLISEKTISPKGTGQAGIWIFTSLEDLTTKIGSGFRKLI